MKIEVKENLFAKMIESVKHCIPKCDNRKCLEFIRLKVGKGKLIAYACDGYRAAKTTISLYPPAEQEFECYIKPIKIKPSKIGINPVVIEYDNNIASVEVITEFGKVKYCFEQTEAKYIDIEKVYQGTASCDRKIGMSPIFVKSAMSALQQITKIRDAVIFECQESSSSAFLISAKGEGIISEQLILPMRIKQNAEGREDTE